MGNDTGDQSAVPPETFGTQLELAERVAVLADRAGADVAAGLIRQACRRARSPLARVCVIGSTNVGKSHLINELVGTECVTVSVHPDIAAPKVIRSAAVASDRSGICTRERHTVINVKGNTWLDRAGLELVDTPGWDTWAGQQRPVVDANSLARIVVDCDVVLVATEARRALPASEQTRIWALVSQRHNPPVMVVVTKLDEVGDEADDVMRRARHLMRQVAPEVQVFPGPQFPTLSDHLEQCRSALTALASTRPRIALRTLRCIQLLAATCELISEAAERALAGASRNSLTNVRAAEVWHAAWESAQFNWIVLTADLDDRRAALIARFRAEASRRRAAYRAELAKELSEATDARAFVRLRVIPQVELALHDLQAWMTDAMDHALADDIRWLRESLLRSRPGEELSTDIVGPADQMKLSVDSPSSSGRAVDDPGISGASWLSEFVGMAIESALAPVTSEVIAHVLGAAAAALMSETLQDSQELRLDRTIDDLERVVALAFSSHLARAEERVGQVYRQMATRARDRDEQWWRLHTAAMAALPASLQHWRALLDEARALRRSVDAHLSYMEGE